MENNKECNGENPFDYVVEATRTESNNFMEILDRMSEHQIIRLTHAGMGMTTEAGEFIDVLKKYAFYGKPIDKANLVEELGDLMWYIGIACSVLGVSVEKVMELNIGKLRKRYPEKFTNDNAKNRSVDNEMSDIRREVLGDKPSASCNNCARIRNIEGTAICSLHGKIEFPSNSGCTKYEEVVV